MQRMIRLALLAGISCALLFAVSCGGSSSSNSTGGGTSTTANTTAVLVNGGPSSVLSETNGVYVSVTVCKPNTSTCVTIPYVLLDTGSTGLRLLSGQVSGLGLANVTAGAATLANCVQYLDNSYNWGPVATADVKIAGEVASSMPVHIIADPTNYVFAPAPVGCGGTPNNTVNTLLANGILGVSFYQQDCGSACETNASAGGYYGCTGNSCSPATVAVSQQLQNTVGMFSSDNNGLMLTLPSISTNGASSVNGTLTFGIGTQANNALGSAMVITPDSNGLFSTTFKTTTTNVAFIDSGSSLLFFLSAATSGLPECVGANAGLYCPSSTQALTATNRGSNGATSTVSFSVGSADTLLNSNNNAFSNVAGTGTDPTLGPYFDWGLPFFYGRNVFVAIENKTAGSTTGPFWAY